MVRKVAKVCQHLNRNGYRAGHLHPIHILLQPRHDDNIYLVGLHDVIPRLDHVPKNIGEMLKKYQSAQTEFHSDLMGLGLLLYYLLTFHDPSPSGSWNPQEVSPQILHKEKGRLKEH